MDGSRAGTVSLSPATGRIGNTLSGFHTRCGPAMNAPRRPSLTVFDGDLYVAEIKLRFVCGGLRMAIARSFVPARRLIWMTVLVLLVAGTATVETRPESAAAARVCADSAASELEARAMAVECGHAAEVRAARLSET